MQYSLHELINRVCKETCYTNTRVTGASASIKVLRATILENSFLIALNADVEAGAD